MTMESHSGMILTGKPKNWEKVCPSTTLSITNPTWSDLGMNLGLCNERPVTVHLSHGMVLTKVKQH
jgi:hypothetical protein